MGKTFFLRKNLLCLGVVLGILVLQGCYFSLFKISFWPDSETYFSAIGSLAEFRPDIFRTPLYPMILAGIAKLSGSQAQFAILLPLFQSAIFLISLWFLFETCRRLSHSTKFAGLAAALYGILPGICLWNFAVLTEALSMSMMIFLFHSLYCLLRLRRRTAARGIVVWSALLFLLRPNFVLIPVLLAGLLWGFCYRPKLAPSVRPALIGLLAVILGMGGYASAFRYNYGITAPSQVLWLNWYETLRKYHLNAADSSLSAEVASLDRADLKSYYELLAAGNPYDIRPEALAATGRKYYFVEFAFFRAKYSLAAIRDHVLAAAAENSGHIGRIAFDKVRAAGGDPIFHPYATAKSLEAIQFLQGFKFINLSYWWVFALYGIFGVRVIFQAWKRKKWDPFESVLAATAIVCTSAFLFGSGTSDEWSRLLIVLFPLNLLMLASLYRGLDHLRRSASLRKQ